VFFLNIPADTGIAFVVVQHLSRDYKSILDQLLVNYSFMPIVRVTADTEIKPNHIYLLTERIFIKVQDNVLRVIARKEDEVLNRAVNIFFKSLAVNSKSKAIGVILTGMGVDGLEGVQAIDREGGIVYVQDPATTPYKQMPTTMINENHPAGVMAPEDLAKIIVTNYSDKWQR
jgi:two-component system, chemotaxis family, protein-glutamate methylesterase/glutaminase